jgi:DNA-binding Xre family transcriptional regulator
MTGNTECPRRSVERIYLPGEIEWVLPASLQRANLTPRKFADLLRRDGYWISTAQTYKLLQSQPLRYSRGFLEAACNVLNCDPGDLLVRTRASTPQFPTLPKLFAFENSP